MLQRLAGDFRLGVVSNFYGNVGRILADAGIAPLLDVIADSNALGVSKPDARIFAHAVAGLGVQPAETLHVGDSYERDVVAARAAGLRSVWLVRHGTASRTHDVVHVHSLDEVAALLEHGPDAAAS